MIQSIMKKAAVTAVGLMLAPSVWAAQYRVTVDAQMLNDQGYASIFGITDATAPVSFSFIIDTDLAEIDTLPAGTVVNGINSTISTPAHLVPRDAITNLNLTFGTASWTENDLITRSFAGRSYDVMLLGSLSDGSTPHVVFILSNSAGTIERETVACFENSDCVVGSVGTVGSVVEDSLAQLLNIQSSVTLLTKTPTQQLSDLETAVKSINLKQGLSNALDSKLQNTRAAIDESLDKNRPAAKEMLYAFINSVEAQRNKSITDSQANTLISAAQNIIDTLN